MKNWVLLGCLKSFRIWIEKKGFNYEDVHCMI